MNPLRPNTAEDFSEDDLIAFHLHELSPERERAVLRVMAGNPELAAESEAVAADLNALKDVPMHVDRTVLDRNWRALRPSLVPHARPAFPARQWRLPVFTGAAVAFAATLAFVVTQRTSTSPEKREVAHTGPATPNPRPVADQNQAVGNEDGKLDGGPQPLFKGSLNSGLFHPKAGRPNAPVHLLSLAQAPAPPAPAPHFTPAPEAPAPVIASLSTLDQAQPSSPEQEQPRGAGRSKPAARVETRREHTVDVMLAIGGNFIAPHTSVIAVTQRSTVTATHAIAAVGAFHQQFRPGVGYRITTSYSRPDFNYSYGGTGEINSRIYEAAGTYVVQGPHRGRLGTSADAGAGLMAFLPTIPSSNTSYVYRTSGVLGVNVDYAITRHWGARLAYRAQVFKTPNFRYNGGTIPVMSSVTVSNEPSLGVTYSFGK